MEGRSPNESMSQRHGETVQHPVFSGQQPRCRARFLTGEQANLCPHHRPVGLPRKVDGQNRTSGKFRSRLALPAVAGVRM